MKNQGIKYLYAAIISLFISIVAVYATLSVKILLPAIVITAYVAYLNYEKHLAGKYPVIALFVTAVALFVYQSVITTVPHEWDFSCFYLYGSVAAQGMDFYNPSNFAQVVDMNILPHAISDEFRREVMEVGCPYPPPTIYFFLPLGYFSYETALILWKIFHSVIALASVYLVKSIFFQGSSLKGYAIAAILLFFSIPSFDTIRFSQTVYLLLFFLLLTYKLRENYGGGIFLSLAIFVKPFAVILLLWFLISRKWKAFKGFVIGCIVIFTGTLILTGIEPFFEYIINNPAHRQPLWLFTEPTNQSVLATFLRYLPENTGLASGFYYGVTAFVVVITLLVLTRVRRNENYSDLSWVILLSAMLLIYPSGQLFYNLVHIMSLLILLKQFKQPLIKVVFVLLFFALLYKGLLFTGSFVFVSAILLALRVEDKLLKSRQVKWLVEKTETLLPANA